jgi:hypothetical protein
MRMSLRVTSASLVTPSKACRSSLQVTRVVCSAVPAEEREALVCHRARAATHRPPAGNACVPGWFDVEQGEARLLGNGRERCSAVRRHVQQVRRTQAQARRSRAATPVTAATSSRAGRSRANRATIRVGRGAQKEASSATTRVARSGQTPPIKRVRRGAARRALGMPRPVRRSHGLHGGRAD